MAQPTDTQHKPSPNISGGVNDIYLPEVPKVANTDIYLKQNQRVPGGVNDIYMPDNKAL